MRAALKKVKDLRLGVAAPLEVLRRPEILSVLDELGCAILPVEELASGYKPMPLRASICDVIYEQRLVLDPTLGRELLDRCLQRAMTQQDSYAKGAVLELLVAVMLSQVNGFEVTDRNILSRNQEVDVHVTNRNSAGPLGRGQYVVAEAKNWKAPVPRKEYDAFAKKMRTRRGMAKLGVMVTTSTFESGVYVEAIRDSDRDDVIVLLDKGSLPKVWRDHTDVTHGLEAAVKRAVYDHEPE
jgi:restriction endonuclease Mrr